MAIQKGNLYFQFLLISLIIYLSSESELNQIKERRDLQINNPVLLETAPSTITFPTTPSSTSTTGNTTNIPIIRKSSSGNLSSGAIVGIVIPCVGALLAAGIVAALCRSTTSAVPMQQGIPINMTSSLEKFQPPATPLEIIHQQPIISTKMVQQPVAVVENPVVAQPVPVVQQPVAVVQQPVAMVQQPVAVVQEPVAMVQQPVAVVQEQVAMVQQPVTMVQQPVAMVQQPVTVAQQAVPVQVNTIPVKPIVP
jgi:hypothetical protein